jgi:hypothetical protein
MKNNSFISIVSDIVNNKYPDIVKIFEEITGEDFDMDGDIGLASIRNRISKLEENNAGLDSNDVAIQIASALEQYLTAAQINTLIGNINNDVDTDNFNGIVINTRTQTIPYGYSIAFDPESIKEVTVLEQYQVTATLTHIESGDKRDFIFSEWAYPSETTTDIYGRTFLNMDTIPDHQCKTLMINSNSKFVESKGTFEEVMIFKAYKDVLSREYIGSNGLEYWYQELKANNWDQDTLNTAIAFAGAEYNSTCTSATNSAINYLRTNNLIFKDMIVVNRDWSAPKNYSIVFNPELRKETTVDNKSYEVIATVTHLGTLESKVFTFNENPVTNIDYFQNISIGGRLSDTQFIPYSNSYTISYNPIEVKKTQEAQAYTVTATLTHKESGLFKRYFFTENSNVIDNFKNINITNRLTIPDTSIYVVLFNPATKKEQTSQPQTYEVTATVVHVETQQRKEFTFTETVSALEANYDASGRFELYDKSVVTDECQTYFPDIEYVKADLNDQTQERISNAYSVVLNRYVDLEGMIYWHDKDNAINNYTEKLFYRQVAFAAIDYTQCPLTVAKGKEYLISQGYKIDTTGVYTESQSNVLISQSYTQSEDDLSKPIYETVDLTSTFNFGSLSIFSSSASAGEPNSTTRKSVVSKFYNSILKRPADTEGYNYWVADTANYSSERNMAETGWAATVEWGVNNGDPSLTNLKRLVLGYQNGHATVSTLHSYIYSGTTAPTSWYTAQKLVGYEKKTITYPAVYEWQTVKNYVHNF